MGANLIITAEQLETLTLGGGGATSSCGHRHCVFPDSGRYFLRQTLDTIIMLVGKLI